MRRCLISRKRCLLPPGYLLQGSSCSQCHSGKDHNGPAPRPLGTGRGGGRPEAKDGGTVAIPPGDSAALMEGMMLHRQGLACMTRTRKRTSVTETSGVAAAAAVASTTPGKASLAAESPPVDGSRIKKARRRPMTLPQEQQHTVVGDGSGGSGGGVGAGEQGEDRSGGHEERKGETDVGSSAALEKKDEEGQDRGEVEGKAWTTTRKTAGVDGSNGAQGSGDVMEVDEDAGTAGKGMKDASIGGAAHSSGFPLAADGSLPPLPSSGKAGPSGGDGTAPKQRRLELSAPEKLIAQREALGLLMRADEAFQRCDPKYLDAVDNYAYLCLDMVWLLFLMKDMKNLDLASSKLAAVEKGFRKAHGEGLQRLTALKGEYCAEKLLYVRLHLLQQGVVAFLRGDLGKASALLLRASAEAKALRPNPALAARLMQQWHTVKFEVLQPKLALRALRVGRNDLDAAWQYLENLWQRKATGCRHRPRRFQSARRVASFRVCPRGGSYVDGGLIDQLAQAGFPRLSATRALRKHNNDIAAALAFLTTGEGGRGSGGVAVARGSPGRGARRTREDGYALRRSARARHRRPRRDAASAAAGPEAVQLLSAATATAVEMRTRVMSTGVATKRGQEHGGEGRRCRSRRRKRRGCSTSWRRTGRTRITKDTWTLLSRTRRTPRTCTSSFAEATSRSPSTSTRSGPALPPLLLRRQPPKTRRETVPEYFSYTAVKKRRNMISPRAFCSTGATRRTSTSAVRGARGGAWSSEIARNQHDRCRYHRRHCDHLAKNLHGLAMSHLGGFPFADGCVCIQWSWIVSEDGGAGDWCSR
ncbi:unnamed protein product [Scytosiphon promiscuus]